MRKSAHSFQLRNDSSERKRDNDNDETPFNSRIFYSICLSLSLWRFACAKPRVQFFLLFCRCLVYFCRGMCMRKVLLCEIDENGVGCSVLRAQCDEVTYDLNIHQMENESRAWNENAFHCFANFGVTMTLFKNYSHRSIAVTLCNVCCDFCFGFRHAKPFSNTTE